MRNFALGLIALCVLTTAAAAGAADSGATTAAGPAYADVQAVSTGKYFAAKQGQQPIRDEDTANLIKQDSHIVQLAIERWSVDNSPPERVTTSKQIHGQGTSYYPTYDKLDSELNIWDNKYGSYTGKRSNSKGNGFYPNPITAANEWVFDGHPVPLGWSADAPGNFTYLYKLDDAGHVEHYRLIFYGTTREGGYDVNGDGVSDGGIIALEGGSDKALFDAASRPWYCNGAVVNAKP